jgi:putative oxidoreductase
MDVVTSAVKEADLAIPLAFGHARPFRLGRARLTRRSTMRAIRNYLPAVGRLLMSSLFIWEGFLQLRNPAATTRYFASVNVPLPALAICISIAIHFLGGLGILIGLKTRWAASLLVLLCLGTAFGVHAPVGDASNMLHFYKNLVMAGGFLYVMAFGAGAFSIDRDGVPV